MTRDELWKTLVEISIREKKFPTEESFSAYTKIPMDTVRKVFKLWITEGKLLKNGNGFIFTNNDIQSKIMKDETVIPVTLKPKKMLKVTHKPVVKKGEIRTSLMLKIIKIVVGIIGTILTGCSIHFTFGFNKLGMNKFWALMLSVSVVCFMAFAFTIKSYMNRKRTTSIFITVLWILGISYSVFTAVSGQFNDFRKYSAKDNSVQISGQNEIYENRLKALEKKQKELLHWREQETEYSLNPDLKVENPVTWKMIQKGSEELKEVEQQITEVEDKLLSNMTSEVVLEETVYNWLESFLGIRADIIQFIIILFPALFIDLCSTVCFTFTFGKEEEA